MTRARTPTIPHRAHLATVLRPAARKRGQPSVGMPPPPHTRQGGLWEVGSDPGIRLRLPKDRRRGVFGYHASGAARRVDQLRSDGEAAEDGARSLRTDDRSLELSEVAVDCCITKAPCGGQRAGRSPADRGKQGIKRSMVVDANGSPLGTIVAPANRHDSPLLEETLDTLEMVGLLPERMNVHLDRGYDSKTTRKKLKARGLDPMISEKGKPAPLGITRRWVVERTNSWNNAHEKLVWCTERRDRVIDFWIAFSEVVITVGRLTREAWTRYRWENRPRRRP